MSDTLGNVGPEERPIEQIEKDLMFQVKLVNHTMACTVYFVGVMLFMGMAMTVYTAKFVYTDAVKEVVQDTYKHAIVTEVPDWTKEIDGLKRDNDALKAERDDLAGKLRMMEARLRGLSSKN